MSRLLPSRFRSTALVPLVWMALGCTGRDLREVIAQQRPQVDPVLGQLAAIRAHAASAPPLTEDAYRLGSEHTSNATPSDVALVYLEDLADPKELGNVPVRIAAVSSSTSTDVLARCAAALETHREPYDPRRNDVSEPDPIPANQAVGVLEACAALRYLFVIKTTAYVPPSPPRLGSPGCPEKDAGKVPAAPAPSASNSAAATVAASGPPCKIYEAGLLRAEVLVYEALNARPLGGFRVSAESPTLADIGDLSDPQALLVRSLGTEFEREYSFAQRGAEKP